MVDESAGRGGAPLGWAPAPAPEAVAQGIRAVGGKVTFARFMELALTHPAAGYYTQARSPLGATGDFVTVPQRAPFFNRVLGRLLAELLGAAAALPAAGGAARLLEVGAGEGHMAAGLLDFFEDEAPVLKHILCYQLVEPGAYLRQAQRAGLAQAQSRGWRVEWPGAGEATMVGADSPAGALPAGGPGVLVTNELLDALPVHLLDVRGETPLEAWVQLREGGSGPEVAVVWEEPSAAAAAELRAVLEQAGVADARSLSRDGFVELRPAAGPFLESVARALGAAFVVTIDYGAWRGRPPSATSASTEAQPAGALPGGREAAAVRSCPCLPQLHELTVRGYFRHERRYDLLSRAGRQDLTADVDFAALDSHGRRLGFETLLFMDLASFLAAGGATAEVERLRSSAGLADTLQADAEASLLEALLDPADVGGLFKVMVQVRDEADSPAPRPASAAS